MPRNVILDVDTGVDDAFALLYATRHPDLSVLGITCVDGNTNIAQVCSNTLQVLDRAQAGDIPVARGAAHPLMGGVDSSEHVHGDDGLGGLSTTDTSRTLDSRHAIELMRDLVEAAVQPVTLLPVGPLTNVALFILTFPETAQKLERIFLMGGSASGGNMTASAEFNVWHDPEAAHIVFSSGIPITMYGLDVFYDLTVSKHQAKELREAGSECAIFAADLIDFRLRAMDSEMSLGDYGAIASLLYPELTKSVVMNVAVDTSQGPGRGQTICDRRPDIPELYGRQIGNPCSVIVEVDAEAMVKMWLERVA